MKNQNKSKYNLLIVIGVIASMMFSFFGFSQQKKSELPPPPAFFVGKSSEPKDSSELPYEVKKTITPGYDELLESKKSPIDLRDPSNIKMETEYDVETGCYIVRTKLGDKEITTPFYLSAADYNNKEIRESMMDYYR